MLTPVTEQELGEAIRQANGPLAIRGGGTRLTGQAGEALSVAGLSGITLYEPGALTMVAQAGTPLAEIEAALAAENQRLAFEPMDHRGLLGTDGTPTIGGVFAANVSGPRRVQAGAARDFLLGVRYIDGMGQAIKNGGRVMKNVTGYDLVKLMAGSWGTLGVLSEVSFKVLPRPECTGTLVWRGLGWTAAQVVFTEAMKSPFEVTGAGRFPRANGKLAETIIRVEGFEDSVKYRLKRLRDTLSQKPDDILFEEGDASPLWRDLRDVSMFHGQEGNVWRTSVKPSDMIDVTGKWNFKHVVDWAGGLIWTLAPEDLDLRAELRGVDGHATLIRATPETRARLGMFQPQPAPLEALAQGLRAKFDPRGIFNPGLMGARR